VYCEKEKNRQPHYTLGIDALVFVILFAAAFFAFAPPRSPDAPLVLLIGTIGAVLFVGLCEIADILRHIASRLNPDDDIDE